MQLLSGISSATLSYDGATLSDGVHHWFAISLTALLFLLQLEFKESSFGTGQLAKGGKSGKPVFCFPILSVMLAMNQTHIDYFSLDVEGFEMDILETVPFDKLDITTLSVEYEHLSKENKEYMIKFMEKNGYTLHMNINENNPTWIRDYIFVKKPVDT